MTLHREKIFEDIFTAVQSSQDFYIAEETEAEAKRNQEGIEQDLEDFLLPEAEIAALELSSRSRARVEKKDA